MEQNMQTFVNQSLAKGLSKNSIDCLVQVSKSLTEAIDDSVRQSLILQNSGKSPAKLANELKRNISLLVSRPGVIGGFIQFSSRRFGYYYITPELVEDRLTFSLAFGSINGRSIIRPPGIYPVVEITRHSIERLHQRLNTTSLADVYLEIVSITPMAFTLYTVANQSGAKRWPLPSLAGIFVAAPSTINPLSTLITWMPYANLNKKWMKIVDDFNKVPDMRGFNLNDAPLFAEILEQHSWLQNDYERKPEDN